MLLGVPAALLAATLAGAYPKHAALIVLCSGLFCVAVGLAAQVLAEPLGPERSRWLHAIASASRGALEPEPDAALIAALRALDKSNLDSSTRCEIWQRHPEQSLSINVAGYLQVDAARAPERLYELAQAEPHNTLRTSVLQEMQVRRPEVRPLLAWLQARGALCVTLIVEQDAAIGFLLVPRGRRRSAMTIEEVESLQLLTQRLSALLAVSSALARSREREVQAREQAQLLQSDNERLQRQQAGRAQADRAFAEMLARPVRAARYSATARHTAAQIEAANRTGRSILLLTPAGVDAVGWAAFAHLDGAHQGGPLLVIDASSAAGEPETALWDEAERSPFKLAEGGTLVIVNFQSLLTQGATADAGLLQVHNQLEHLEPRAATAPALVLVCNTPLSAGVESWASRHLTRGTLQRIALPTLLERAEDLRPLILEHLTRLGPGADGEPLGVEPAALRTLMDHTWPGNDAELKGVLTRAHARCRGPRITLDDVAELDVGAAAPARPPAADVLDPLLTEFSFATSARRRHSPRKH
jgi:transcriptional regulator with AAA-type ATPase domain